MPDNQFMVAAAEVNITPDLDAYDVHLHGYGARGSKVAEGVHDPLYGKILVMQQGDTTAVLLTLDILQIDGLLLEAVVEQVGLRQITADSLVICASHTHSAPAALQKRSRNMMKRLNWYHPDYYEYCVNGLAKGIHEALLHLQPACYGVASTNLHGLVRNRRVASYNYDTRAFSGPLEADAVVDNELVVLQFASPEGEPIATLVNLAAHGTVLGADNLMVSADWAGYMQKAIEASLGGVCLYSNGAEGNLAPDCGDGKLGFAEAEAFGMTISAKVIEAAAGLALKEPGHLGVYSTIVQLPDYDIPSQSPFLQAGLDREFVENFVRESYPTRIRQTLLRLDDIAMLTIPGEMFTEHSIEFKSRAKAEGIGTPLILGLANDSIGYMLPAEQYTKEGYETGMCVYGPGLGADLINEGLSNLQKLFPHA
jgi:neutral ceramidase